MGMRLKRSLNDFPCALLNFFTALLPAEEKIWARAMTAELEEIGDPGTRWTWVLSGSWGLAKLWTRGRLLSLKDDGPLPVSLIAFYDAAFCCVLVGTLIGQLPLLKTPLSQAFIPLLIALFLACLPGFIAVGLWLVDDAARIQAILFSLFHALANLAWLSTSRPRWPLLPRARIALDFVMIVALLLPSVKRAFRPPPVRLRLLD